MPKVRWENLSTVVVVFLILAFVGYNAYENIANRVTRREWDMDYSMQQEEVKEWSAPYDVIAMDDPIYDHLDSDSFTINIKEVLVSSGRPLLFRGSLRDIYEDGGTYYTLFDVFYPLGWSLSGLPYVRLACDEEQIEELRFLPGSDRALYVIAIISDVRKVDVIRPDYDDEVLFLTGEETLMLEGELVTYKSALYN